MNRTVNYYDNRVYLINGSILDADNLESILAILFRVTDINISDDSAEEE